MRRVAVSGMGAVTPCGVGVAALKDALRSGARAFGVVEYPAPRQKRLFGKAPLPFDTGADRIERMALAAAREALGETSSRSCALILSTISGGSEVFEDAYPPISKCKGTAAHDSEKARARIANGNLADRVGQDLGLKGPKIVLTNACASGNVAIGLAMDWIRHDQVDRVLVVGADVMKLSTLWGAEASGFIGRTLSPFDERRTGAILGDGAAALLLTKGEDTEYGDALAWIDGFGCVCDRGAAAITLGEDGDGLSRAMQAALAECGELVAAVDLISAHAPGTKGIDRIEALSIRNLFGPNTPAVNATKSITCHLSGASAVVEAVAGILQINGAFIHGNAGLVHKGADILVDVETAQAREARPKLVLSNACGGGGTNTSVAICAENRETPAVALVSREVVVTAAEAFFSQDGASLSVTSDLAEAGFDGDYLRAGSAAQFALAAGSAAMRKAYISGVPGDRFASIGGTCLGGYFEALDAICDGLQRDPPSVLPSEALNHGLHLGTSLVARAFDLRGYTATVSGSPLSGPMAFLLACQMVSWGRADAAVCVIYDSAKEPKHMLRFGAPTEPEGAVAFVVEPCDAAGARGATTLARPTVAFGKPDEAIQTPHFNLCIGPAKRLYDAVTAADASELAFGDGRSESVLVSLAKA